MVEQLILREASSPLVPEGMYLLLCDQSKRIFDAKEMCSEDRLWCFFTERQLRAHRRDVERSGQSVLSELRLFKKKRSACLALIERAKTEATPSTPLRVVLSFISELASFHTATALDDVSHKEILACMKTCREAIRTRDRSLSTEDRVEDALFFSCIAACRGCVETARRGRRRE